MIKAEIADMPHKIHLVADQFWETTELTEYLAYFLPVIPSLMGLPLEFLPRVVAAEMFDEIIIRQDKNLRGKTEEELIEMILNGIKSIDQNKPITIIPSEREAIIYAFEHAKKGSMLVLCSDVVPDALNLVMQFKEEEVERLKKA